MTLKLSLLGTGLMGAPMAPRLCAAGLPVPVWNRTRAKAEALRPHCAQVADSANDAVRDADLVITMLEHGDAVQDLLFAQGVAEALPRGALLVDMSSIRPAEARAHAAALAERGDSSALGENIDRRLHLAELGPDRDGGPSTASTLQSIQAFPVVR